MSHDGSAAAAQTDTTPKALERYRQRIRSTPPRERLARAFELSNRVLAMTMADIERSMPQASVDEVAVAFVRRVYGDVLAARLAKRVAAR